MNSYWYSLVMVFGMGLSTHMGATKVYRWENGVVEIQPDTGQPGLRDVQPPDEAARLRQLEVERKLKKGRELERAKMVLPKLKLQGRIAKPRMPFSKISPSLIDLNAYDEAFGTHQGRWKIQKDAEESIRQLKP